MSGFLLDEDLLYATGGGETTDTCSIFEEDGLEEDSGSVRSVGQVPGAAPDSAGRHNPHASRIVRARRYRSSELGDDRVAVWGAFMRSAGGGGTKIL